MASKNVKVSQNFCEISRVSQSRFLSVSESLKSLEFFAKPFWSLILGLAIQRPQKSRSRKEKRWSRRLAKARIYHSPPLVRI